MIDFETWYIEIYEELPEEDKAPNDDLLEMYRDYLFDVADISLGGF